MEQAPWKPILYGVIFSLIMLMLVYFFALPKNSWERSNDRILEFNGSKIIGRSEGKKVWEFTSAGGWVGKNQDVTNLENVKDGIFYKDGKTTIKDFSAATVSAFRQTKNIEAASIRAKVSSSKKFMDLSADSLTYNLDRQNFFLRGNVNLFDRQTRLKSEEMEIADDQIFARRKVSIHISGREKTTLNCEIASFFSDENKGLTASGEVTAYKGKKTAAAQTAVYNKNGNSIILSGGVKAVIEKGRALIKEDTANKLRNKDVRQLLEDKTLQFSDALIMGTENGDSKALGNVVVVQKGKEARADQADYNDRDETITLSGNVVLKEKERYAACQKIIISVKDQTLLAVGKVEAGFNLHGF